MMRDSKREREALHAEKECERAGERVRASAGIRSRARAGGLARVREIDRDRGVENAYSSRDSMHSKRDSMHSNMLFEFFSCVDP